jgi:hypothetical protein
MENAGNLGNLISEHTKNKTATGATLLIGLACLGIGAMMWVLFSGEKEMSFNKFLFGFGGLAGIGGGISCIWTVLTNRGSRVALYKNGLIVEKGGRRQTALWDEIGVVKETIEQVFFRGKYVYDRYSYTIEKKNGETFNLSNMISDVEQIGRLVKEKTFERLYPEAVEKINRGEKIRFDLLELDKNGFGGAAWTDFSGFRIKDGMIEVKDKGGKAIVSSAYGAMPNVHLLIALLKERLPLEQ